MTPKLLAAMTMIALLTARADAQDLFLAQIHQAAGKLVADNVVRLTKRTGYDSQPSFVGNTDAIVYTSIGDDGVADIWRYDPARRTTSAITTTKPESEYSATLMPDGQRFSIVRVERDSTQRLWSMAADGTDLRVVLDSVKGVGYYTWLDGTHVVAYILGDPSMLELIDTRTGARHAIAGDVGRTIQKVPGRNAISFVQNLDDSHFIYVYDVDKSTMTFLAKTPEENEFYTWTPGGILLSAEGSVVYVLDPAAGGAWKRIADLSASGVAAISRLAVSADGKNLVIVASD